MGAFQGLETLKLFHAMQFGHCWSVETHKGVSKNVLYHRSRLHYKSPFAPSIMGIFNDEDLGSVLAESLQLLHL
jgi:hypothetical protein